MVAEAKVNPTENVDKVKESITNLFSGEIETRGQVDDYGSVRLVGEGHGSLETFRMILQRDRIRAAARAQLFRGMDENRIVVFLNKQVAYARHVSFSAPEGESPLGPIRLSIETEKPTDLIDWLTGGFEQRPRKRSLDR